jgi:predicted MPP superfamily phosphohydrolase
LIRFLLRRIAFERPLTTVSLLLGAMQFALGAWIWVVLLGGARPHVVSAAAWVIGLGLANVALVPLFRRWNRQRVGRRVVRAYLSLGFATAALGGAITAWWALFAAAALWLRADADGAQAAVLAFRACSTASVAGLGGLLAWGFGLGHRRLEETQIRVELPGLAPELRGLRLVQLSDLHIGNAMEGEALARLVARANALAPDVLVLTGDLFDFDPAVIEHGARELAKLRARLGVYAVLGNHDRYAGVGRVAAAFAALAPELRVLRGERVRLPCEAPLWLAGVDDPGTDWTRRDLDDPILRRLAETRPADEPEILLVHRPEIFPLAVRLGWRLVLAGHTHGGQLALPGTGGRINVARLITRFDRGLHRLGDSALYVHRGCGVAGPRIRLSCPREIATIELA